MAGDWEDLTLGDLGRVVTGKTPLTAVEGNFGGQIPFVTPSDMDGRKSISTTARGEFSYQFSVLWMALHEPVDISCGRRRSSGRPWDSPLRIVVDGRLPRFG